MQPYCPVTRSAYLVPLKVEELIGRDICGKDVAAVSMKHGRENDAMEDDIVFSNKMHQLGVLAFPPFLPIIAFQLLGETDITDWGIKPHIQHLAVGSLNRYLDTPVEVACNGTRLETGIYPRLALTINIGLPIALMLLQNPLAKPWLVLVKGEIPMLRLTHHRGIAAQCRLGVDKVSGIQRGATSFALITVCTFIATMGAGTRDVTVSKKLMRLFVIILHRSLLNEFPLLIQFLEII